MTTPTIPAALDAAEQHATFKVWAGHPLAIILEGLIKKIRAALNAEAPPTMELGALFDRHCFEDDYGNKYLNAEAFESAALELSARAALAAEPVGEGPSHREICHWLEQQAHWGENIRLTPRIANMIQDALARWARPAAPAAPEPGSATALATWLRKHSGQCVELGRPDWAHMADRSADTLEAFGLGGWIVPTVEEAPPAPAVVPVVVAERLPGEGDCDAEGRCWLTTTSTGPGWVLDCPERCTGWTHWVPAGAIPAMASVGRLEVGLVPVALDERLPGKEDCAPWPDEPESIPWCWAGKYIDGWEWMQLSMLGLRKGHPTSWFGDGGWTHWLPFHAIPLPQAGEGES